MTDEVFDYKITRNIDVGKQVLFFHSLDNEKITIGAIDYIQNKQPSLKKFEYVEKYQKGVYYKIYPLNDEFLLLEIINVNNRGFKIIPYSEFK